MRPQHRQAKAPFRHCHHCRQIANCLWLTERNRQLAVVNGIGLDSASLTDINIGTSQEVYNDKITLSIKIIPNKKYELALIQEQVKCVHH